MNNYMPREKVKEYGIESLTNNELLALIVKSGYKNRNVFELIDDILLKCNGFENLLALSYEELIEVKGIKQAKALEILAILEIYKRLARNDVINEKILNSPQKIVEWLRYQIAFVSQEQFCCVYLNGKGSIIKNEILFKGSKNQSTIGIDEVIRRAILYKASYLIVAHNHPGGDISPSKPDLDLTDRLSKACKMVNIPLLDHIIVSNNDYFSFKSHNLL